jgi:AraC-like DNA-binding protein
LFRHRAVPSSAPFVLDLQRFLAGIDVSARRDALASEERAVELVRSALALDERVGGNAGARTPVQRERMQIAQAFLNESFARPVRLSDVARAAHCSVWHVCKEFRRTTGSSIHEWLVRLRLRHAIEALRRGADDLTELALATGFSSHSHFAAAFRREFGITPRAAREALTRRTKGRRRNRAEARRMDRASAISIRSVRQ